MLLVTATNVFGIVYKLFGKNYQIALVCATKKFGCKKD